MKKRKLTDEQINEIIKLYQTKEFNSTHKLSEKFKVTHKTISNILKEHNIQINKRGGQLKYGREVVVQRYQNKNRKDGKTLIAVCRLTGKKFNDYSNVSGSLTQHLIKHYPNIVIPSAYKRRMFLKTTGTYWYEEYFDIIDSIQIEKLKCRYCDWETIDITNKSGAYTSHLKEQHNKSITEYLLDFPEDIFIFSKINKENEYNLEIGREENFVTCNICGKKMKTISNTHLKTHKITADEYKLKYSTKLMSKTLTTATTKRLSHYNESNNVNRYVSNEEKKIKEIIKNCGYSVISNDRKILKGKEIDILIPEIKLGIEYNGNLYHTENYGKKYPNYHLDKLIKMNEYGYNLIQIFEDEWILKNEIVVNKIIHLIGKSKGKKIGGRQCEIREILTNTSNVFLDKFHIQGSDTSSIKLGCFYNDKLVGVMTFKQITPIEFELSRFATDYNYIISGLGNKVLKYFINKYKPKTIISFADRRWTLSGESNLYVKLGFTLCDITKPDYKYYNSKIHKYKRFHKYMFRKKNLREKYNFDMSLTEKEMTQQLGYDRIWDCGLFKYKLNIK